jgi:hypothetical protein
MIRIVKILAPVIVIMTLISCRKKNNPDPISQGDPSAATLVFPDNNLECTEGTVVNDTQSTVIFQWQASANTSSYVNLKNLNTTSSSSINSNTNEASITLERGVPYEWFVVSKSNGSNATAQSDTWRFYNAGGSTANYAPFPASALSPTRGQTVSASCSIDLEWEGNDVDNDLTEFEVFFGTTNDPITSLGTTAQSSISATISSGTTYYWRVISKDAAGNSSESDVFDFKVQ